MMEMSVWLPRELEVPVEYKIQRLFEPVRLVVLVVGIALVVEILVVGIVLAVEILVVGIVLEVEILVAGTALVVEILGILVVGMLERKEDEPVVSDRTLGNRQE